MSTGRSRSKYSSGTPYEYSLDTGALIGQIHGGDLEWGENGLLRVPETALREHGVISGGSGSGKSTFCMRLTAECARTRKWRIYYMDAKADEDTAVQFAAVMAQSGIKTRVFPNEPMDGWRGDSAALRNRLLQLLTYSESFYRDGARLLVGLALDAPNGIPRSSNAFLRRLDRPLLERLYAGTPRAGVLSRIDSIHVDGTMLRYESFFTAAQHLLDGAWTWEDTRAAYIALDSVGAPDDTQALGRFLIEDFGHFIKYRKPKDERVLLLIDEFSALAEQIDIANLFQRIRSAGGSVFVIVHGDASMRAQADKLFQACANIIVFQSNDPENLIVHAGTRLVPDYSQHRPGQHHEASITPVGLQPPRSSTLHMREKPKIDANQVRQLRKGEGFWIYQGRSQRFSVNRLSYSEALLGTIRQQLLPLRPPALPANTSPLCAPNSAVNTVKPPVSTGSANSNSPNPGPSNVPVNSPSSSVPGPANSAPVPPKASKKKGRGLFDA